MATGVHAFDRVDYLPVPEARGAPAIHVANTTVSVSQVTCMTQQPATVTHDAPPANATAPEAGRAIYAEPQQETHTMLSGQNFYAEAQQLAYAGQPMTYPMQAEAVTGIVTYAQPQVIHTAAVHTEIDLPIHVLCQMQACIPEVVYAMRACIKETNQSMLFSANSAAGQAEMEACGKYVMSQFVPQSEHCAYLVDGYVAGGTTASVARHWRHLRRHIDGYGAV